MPSVLTGTLCTEQAGILMESAHTFVIKGSQALTCHQRLVTGAVPCALGAHTVGTPSDEGTAGTRALALLGSEQFKGEGVGSRRQEARRDWQVTESICGGPERGPAVRVPWTSLSSPSLRTRTGNGREDRGWSSVLGTSSGDKLPSLLSGLRLGGFCVSVSSSVT